MRYLVTITVDIEADNARDALSEALAALDDNSGIDTNSRTVTYTVEELEDEDDEEEDT